MYSSLFRLHSTHHHKVYIITYLLFTTAHTSLYVCISSEGRSIYVIPCACQNYVTATSFRAFKTRSTKHIHLDCVEPPYRVYFIINISCHLKPISNLENSFRHIYNQTQIVQQDSDQANCGCMLVYIVLLLIRCLHAFIFLFAHTSLYLSPLLVSLDSTCKVSHLGLCMSAEGLCEDF